MMRKAIFYPILFVFYVILTPLVQNYGQIDPSQAEQPVVLLLAATVVGLLLFYAVFKDWQYSGYLVFLLLFFMFVPGQFSQVLQSVFPAYSALVHTSAMLVSGVILVLFALKKVWMRLGGATKVTPALNFVLTVALFSQGIFALPKVLRDMHQPAQGVNLPVLPATGSSIALDCSTRPDIYYIILDAYGSSDVLNAFYGTDNTPFLDFLKSKGFYVADQSHSNYIQTIYSISSSLNFSYIAPEPAGESGQVYFTQKIADNQIMQALKSCGYQTVAFQTDFAFTDHPDADQYLSRGNGLNEFENLLVGETPLASLMDKLNAGSSQFGYQAHRAQILYTLDQLSELPEKPGPKFVFAHIISPHPPFVFDAHGGHIQPDRSFSLADGSDFQGTLLEYHKGYAGQVQFIDQKLEKVVDDILARSKTPPIIILQGDHGPGGSLDWSSPERTCLYERTSILNAYYLPGQGASRLYSSISPVNSFRVILNAYFGSNLELLPDKTYFTSVDLPRQEIDITAERTSMNNCPSTSP
jgi:hypothetical protein